jgi:hypothetical protein
VGANGQVGAAIAVVVATHVRRLRAGLTREGHLELQLALNSGLFAGTAGFALERVDLKIHLQRLGGQNPDNGQHLDVDRGHDQIGAPTSSDFEELDLDAAGALVVWR